MKWQLNRHLCSSPLAPVKMATVARSRLESVDRRVITLLLKYLGFWGIRLERVISETSCVNTDISDTGFDKSNTFVTHDKIRLWLESILLVCVWFYTEESLVFKAKASHTGKNMQAAAFMTVSINTEIHRGESNKAPSKNTRIWKVFTFVRNKGRRCRCGDLSARMVKVFPGTRCWGGRLLDNSNILLSQGDWHSLGKSFWNWQLALKALQCTCLLQLCSDSRNEF